VRKQPQLLKIITDAEVDRIHETSLSILEDVGVQFPNQQVLDLFEAAGAQVDSDNQLVRIPATLVETALATLPKDFSTVPPDGGPPIHLGDGELKLSMDCTDRIIDARRKLPTRWTT
jgi:trimethylamine--corrinoid protein Co-methyltransferase